ncbi:hypothetical protein ACNOYE_35810 [Nannocystaceae bacterium ST9]
MRLRQLGVPTLSCLSALLLGCTDDISGSDTTTTNGDDVAESDTTGDTGAEQDIPARGDIALTTVVVNQGVDVPIAIDGVWVGPEDRNTYLVGNRDSLVRAYWTIPEDWVAREIKATLDVEYPDGTKKTLTDVKMVDDDAFAGDLDRGFYWSLIGDAFDPGLKFQIKLWEAGPGFEDQRESTSILVSPIAGMQLIGVQPEPMQLKVQFVPTKYDAGACHTDTSTITEEEVQNFVDYLHEQNPVQEVLFDFRTDAKILWGEQLNSLAELWQPLLDLRVTDNAPPNMYYYALVDVCGPGIGDAAGIAPGTPPPTKDAASSRVCSGVWLGGDKYSYHTFVHEIGHTQGRPHTFCEGGGAAGTDPAYPHDNGIIGVWGFGIRFFKLYNPTGTYDYMSYCLPGWVSDWTWSKTYVQGRELTSWDFEGPAQPGAGEPGQGELLYGLLMPNGTERWYTAPGAREADYFGGEQTVAFDYGEGEVQIPAAVELLDDRSLMVVAPVPKPGQPIVDLRRITSEGDTRTIDLARMNSRKAYSIEYAN